MVNYNNGKIYKIVDNTNGNIYIGSTIKKYLSSRLALHKSNYKRFLEGKVKTCCSCKLIFENNDYDIILLELVNCNSNDELKARERYYMENNDCVNKNITGRTRKEYYKDNKEEIKEKSLKYYNENKDKVLEKNKNYYNKNKDIISQQIKNNYKQNKDKIKEYTNKRINFINSWGGDSRYHNNLLKIDISLFNTC